MSREQKHLNPFTIDICKSIASIETKIMLIYSKDDSIVSYEHSKEISQHCRRSPIELEIAEDHNKPRKTDTYIRALHFIQNSIEYFESRVKRSKSRGRGISVSSKENAPNYHNNSAIRRSICNSTNSEKMSILNETKNKVNTNLVHIGTFNSSFRQYSPKNFLTNTGS